MRLWERLAVRNSSGSREAVKRPHRWRRWLIRVLILGVVGLLLLAGWRRALEDLDAAHFISRPPAERRVAVVPLPKPKGRVKVLAIDGGGVRGLIAARSLAELEKRAGKPAFELFDLVAGTSTGSIIAAMMCSPGPNGGAKFTAEEIVELYTHCSNEALRAPLTRRILTLDGIIGPKLDTASKRHVLDHYLGGTLFSDLLRPVSLNTYEPRHRRPRLLSNMEKEYRGYYASDIVSASTAAPTLFQPVTIQHADHRSRLTLIDAGFYENTSVRIAFTEARRLFPGQDILIVHLGTGLWNLKMHADQYRKWGRLQWTERIFVDIVDANAAVSQSMIDLITNLHGGDREEVKIYSLNPLLAENYSTFDPSSRNLKALEKVTNAYLESETALVDEVVAALQSDGQDGGEH